MKRQISNLELRLIQAGVGLGFAVLTYMLAATWTCGFLSVVETTANLVQQTSGKIFLYLFIIFWFSTGVLFNITEYLLWKYGLRQSFSPVIPPGDFNPYWIPIPTADFIGSIKKFLFAFMPIYCLCIIFFFVYQIQPYCQNVRSE
jgi:hypothetical protein